MRSFPTLETLVATYWRKLASSNGAHSHGKGEFRRAPMHDGVAGAPSSRNSRASVRRLRKLRTL
jgi:hypothetical protein